LQDQQAKQKRSERPQENADSYHNATVWSGLPDHHSFADYAAIRAKKNDQFCTANWDGWRNRRFTHLSLIAQKFISEPNPLGAESNTYRVLKGLFGDFPAWSPYSQS
jgi:hypothetical protein